MTIEEKAKRYDEAIERAKHYQKVNGSAVIPAIFPELKESEDERIRKELIDAVQGLWDDDALPMPLSVKRKNEWLAWLEKQDTKEPFKVGDWVVRKDGENFCNGCKFAQITNIDDDKRHWLDSDSWLEKEDIRLWTIQDARDGDVLASDCSVFIFQKEYIAGKPTAYCGIVEGNFCQGSGGCWTNEPCYPATKEQRDLLEKTMTDTGYAFDFEKKELKEITASESEADDEEDDKEADDKAENWKLTLARQRLENEARTWKTPKVRKYE